MQQLARALCFAFVLALLQPSPALTAEAATDGSAKFAPPHRLKVDVQWPGEVDREALVRVRFRIHADGHVSDVQLQDGRFSEKRFDDEVLRALKTARYAPAMANGDALDDYYVQTAFVFIPEGGPVKGISAGFRREMQKVDKLIRGKDYAGANFHAQWMVAEAAKGLYEYAALQAQLAYTHAAVGNIHRAIAAAHLGSQRKSPISQQPDLDNLAPPNNASYYMLPKDIVIGLLNLRFTLAASKGMLLDSIESYQELAGLEAIPASDPRVKVASTIVAALRGDKPLVAQLRVDEDHYVGHDMFRRTFAIAPKIGKPDKIMLVCADHRRELEYQPGVDWTIPASWEQCTVSVQAEPGTEFDLIEYTPGTKGVQLPED